MYGLIGQIVATPGDRAELAEILVAIGDMPGCLSYVVAEDSSDPDALWVTEVWDSAESHAQSLDQPEVRSAIERGRPLISAFNDRTETRPMGGIGIPPAG
jgi:quinol monooxygenase YgiN